MHGKQNIEELKTFNNDAFVETLKIFNIVEHFIFKNGKDVYYEITDFDDGKVFTFIDEIYMSSFLSLRDVTDEMQHD